MFVSKDVSLKVPASTEDSHPEVEVAVAKVSALVLGWVDGWRGELKAKQCLGYLRFLLAHLRYIIISHLLHNFILFFCS